MQPDSHKIDYPPLLLLSEFKQQGRSARRRDVAKCPSPRWPSSRLFCVRRASEVFSQSLAQRRHVEHRLGEKLLELAVLLVERLQPARIRDLHAAEARAPRVERRVADAVAAADLSHRKPSRLLLQDDDDLLFAEPTFLHRPSPYRRTLASERRQTRGQGQPTSGFPVMNRAAIVSPSLDTPDETSRSRYSAAIGSSTGSSGAASDRLRHP